MAYHPPNTIKHFPIIALLLLTLLCMKPSHFFLLVLHLVVQLHTHYYNFSRLYRRNHSANTNNKHQQETSTNTPCRRRHQATFHIHHHNKTLQSNNTKRNDGTKATTIATLDHLPSNSISSSSSHENAAVKREQGHYRKATQFNYSVKSWWLSRSPCSGSFNT
jgi:hypothetical protein